MILEKFYTNEFDNDIVLCNKKENYTWAQLKEYVYSQKLEFDKETAKAVVLLGNDSFEFIVNFFAGLFSDKEIYLLTDKNKLSSLNVDYFLPKAPTQVKNLTFQKIEEERTKIVFFTSGSTAEPKTIIKNFTNLENEAKGITSQFVFNSGKNIYSTTIMSHMFGLTFHFMVALYAGLVIQAEKIEFPEQITQKEPFILVSSPSFLEKMAKYEIDFTSNPYRIITAGAKLKSNVQKFFASKSEIIEIYGSTETGVIAYNKNSTNFKKFDVVSFSTDENNCIIVKSNFFMEEKIPMEAVLETISDEEFSLVGRNDRLVKIKEKRVSLVELETALKEYNSVIDAYCFKYEEVLACVIVTKDISLTDKILKEYLSKYSEILPKKWRFLDEIPKTVTGKIDKERLNQIFGLNLSYPFILERRQSENSVELDVIFKKTSNFFKGHFPNIPVLPGVVQLFYANWFSKEVFNIEISKEEAKKVKFTNIIRAGDMVTIKLKNNEKNVEFSYVANDKVYSSGIFVK